MNYEDIEVGVTTSGKMIITITHSEGSATIKLPLEQAERFVENANRSLIQIKSDASP